LENGFNLHTVTAYLTRKQAIFWSSTLPEGRPFPSTLAGFWLFIGVQNGPLLCQQLTWLHLYNFEGLLDLDLFNNCVSTAL
jgi:hypothetical protein